METYITSPTIVTIDTGQSVRSFGPSLQNTEVMRADKPSDGERDANLNSASHLECFCNAILCNIGDEASHTMREI